MSNEELYHEINQRQYEEMGNEPFVDPPPKQALVLSPANLPVLSKTSAAGFHQAVKQRIFETGNGLFEYVELVKFFGSLDKQISGDSASKIEPDKEFISYIRERITETGEKDKVTTARGVKFECAETGTTYDFSKCEDPILDLLQIEYEDVNERLKARKEFLKKLPADGLDILHGGKLIKIFPPAKSSKSSFKVIIPR